METNIHYHCHHGTLLRIMVRNLDTVLLRSFAAVAETGGMTASARRLNLTQAAISQHIKRLEDQLGCKLFERERAGLRLTFAGERLHRRALRLLELNDEIWNVMTAPEFEGEVRLGVPHDIITPHIPPVLRRFVQAWPRVQVSLVTGVTLDLKAQVEEGSLDLCLTTERDCEPWGEVLATQRLLWVGAPGGTAHLRNPLPVSLGDERCIFRGAVTDALGAIGRDWRSCCVTSEMQPLLASVEADIGVAALLESSVPAHLEVLTFQTELPELPDFGINLYVARAAGTLPQELARFMRQEILSDRKLAA